MLNPSSNLYKSEWLDLVFKNRNKTYGAYSLRSESSSITLRAFFIAAPVFIMLFAGPMLYKRLHPEVLPVETTMTTVDVLPTTDPPEPIKKKADPPAPEPVEKKVKIVKMVANIKVVERPVVEETMPDLKELQNAVVGQNTQDGTATRAVVTPTVTRGNGTGTGPVADDTIHEPGSLDKYPEFEGGMAAWAKFIQRNLRYPYTASEQGISGKVFVSFVIELDGSISAVKIIKGIGGGCDEEAIRVLKKSPRWKPGQQNNQSVRVRYTMPLAFVLGE